MSTDIRVRRVYDNPSPGDGARVLVDRVWPRGLRKDAARLDDWAKDVAPSTGLRTWYRHDPAKFGEFRRPLHRRALRARATESPRPPARPSGGRAGDAADRHEGPEPQPGGGSR